LALRSKKVSEFGDPLLQLGKTLDEIGHANHSNVKVRCPAGDGNA